MRFWRASSIADSPETRYVTGPSALPTNTSSESLQIDCAVRRGYQFIPLAEALKDDAYRLPDEFVGALSNSWFNHWEITRGRPPIPTPAQPAWVR